MLFPTCLKKFLFACPSYPPWNLPSCTVESTFSSPCSRFDPPFSLQDVALVYLNSLPPHNLVIWTDGPILFCVGKGDLASLPTTHFVALRRPFPFPPPVCSSFSTETCAILQLLSWSRQHQLVCHCSSLSSSPTLGLSLPLRLLFHLSFYLKLSGRSGTNRLLYYQATMGPRTLISLGNDAADELARQGALLVRSLIPCSVSPLTSCIHSCLFSDWKRTVSSKFFDTQDSPSVSTAKLYFLVTLAALSLVFAATDSACC